jgi:hypothetical protein
MRITATAALPKPLAGAKIVVPSLMADMLPSLDEAGRISPLDDYISRQIECFPAESIIRRP